MGIISEIRRRSGVVFWTLPTRLLTPRLTCVRELIPDPWWPRGQTLGTTSVKMQAMSWGHTASHSELGDRAGRQGCEMRVFSTYWTRALTQMLTAFQLIINRFPGRPAYSLHTSFGPVSQWLELLPVLLSLLTGFLLELRKSPPDFGEGEWTHNKHPEHDLDTEGTEPGLSQDILHFS